MKRRTIVSLALALALSLALVAGAQAAGLFASLWGNVGAVTVPQVTNPLARDGVTVDFTAGEYGLIGVVWDGQQTASSVCIYGPKDGAGSIAMTSAIPDGETEIALVAGGTFAAANYGGGGYTVKLFAVEPGGSGLSTNPYRGSYQFAMVANMIEANGSVTLYPLSVDAIKAGPCSTQNSQGQNQNGNAQGWNPQGFNPQGWNPQ